MKKLTLTLIAAFGLTNLCAAPAHAQWPTTLKDNLPVGADPTVYESDPFALPYKNGRTLVVWSSDLQVRYQIIDRFGQFAFPQSQLFNPATPNHHIINPPAVFYSGAGVNCVWETSYPVADKGWYAQKLDSLGNRLWGEAGVMIFSPTVAYSFCACDDGQEGFYFLKRADDMHLWGQHVSASGELLWGHQGLALITTPPYQDWPQACPDGQGGVCAVWSTSGTYCQRFNSLGQQMWTPGGIFITSNYFYTRDIYMVPDGTGGFLLHLNGTGGGSVRRFGGNGSLLWTCQNASGGLGKMVAGEPGYVYLGWMGNGGVSAQRVDFSGNRHWPSLGGSGIIMMGYMGFGQEWGNYCYLYPRFYGVCNFIITYNPGVTGALYVQSLDSLGNRQFGYQGARLAVVRREGMQYKQVVPDGQGGITAVWEHGYGSGPVVQSILAKHCNRDGSLGGPQPSPTNLIPEDSSIPDSTPTATLISAFILSPNPFNASIALSFKLQAASHVNLKVSDTAGRLVATLVDGWREAGTHEVTFDGSKLASGVYLYNMQAGAEKTTGKMLLLK